MGLPATEARAKAIELGLKTYFTGVPCIHGHLAERRTCSWKCVECERVKYYANIEHEKTRQRKVRAKYPRPYSALSEEQKQKKRWAAKKAYYRNPRPEQNRLRAQQWYSNNSDRAYQASRAWKEKHRHKVRMFQRRYKDRKRCAEGECTEDDIQRILKLQRGRCAYCRTQLKAKYERDHIIPISKGGTNYPKNIQLVCAFGCNQKKQAKDPIEFARSLGLLI